MGRYAAVYLVYSPWASDGWQDQNDQAIAGLEEIGFTGVGDSPGLSSDLGAEQALGLEDAGILAVYLAAPDATSAFADAWERDPSMRTPLGSWTGPAGLSRRRVARSARS